MRNFLNLVMATCCAFLIAKAKPAYAQKKKSKTENSPTTSKVKELNLAMKNQKYETEKNIKLKKDSIYKVSFYLDGLKARLAEHYASRRKNSLQLDSITEQRFQKGLSQEERMRINELYNKNREEFVALSSNIKNLQAEISEIEKVKSAVTRNLVIQESQLSRLNLQLKEVGFKLPSQR